jgi:DNA-binding response OmpR family regulator
VRFADPQQTGHVISVSWLVYALPPEPPSAIDQLHVVVIAISLAASTQAAIEQLERDAIRVTVGTRELLKAPPAAGVYIIGVDAAIARVLADGIVQWASSGEADARPGLLGVIEDGSGGDRELLLAAGFDDVVVAPLSARELAGRVRAVHRRVRWGGSTSGRVRFGPLTLDNYGHAVWIDGMVIALTSIELAVLRELMKARGRPLSRGDLLDLAWGGGDLEVSERAVDNVIMRLRRKLPHAELIETVRSVGFRIAFNSPRS